MAKYVQVEFFCATCQRFYYKLMPPGAYRLFRECSNCRKERNGND